MQWFIDNRRAFILSLEVFVALSFVLFLLWVNVDFSQLDTEKYIVILSLSILFLLVKVTFDATKVTSSAQQMAKQMAKELMTSSHELFTELYRGSPVPYIHIDEEGKIVSTNLSALRLFNIEEGAYDGVNFFEAILNDEEDHTALIPEKLKKGLPVDDEEVQIRRSDGSLRWVLLSLFSYVDLQSRKRQGLLTLVDITKQKQIDQAKSEFVSLASHQLRTPISALRWNTELLATTLKDTVSEESAKYLDKITNNIRRMDLLVDDFLNVSKLELGTLRPELTSVPLEPFFKAIFEEHAERIHKKNIQLTHSLDDSIASCVTDPNLLHMIVSNLVSNAAKYTTEGGSVNVRVVGAGGKLIITVSDTGMGIPEDEQDRLFSKIFRASNARADVPEGTGLGLYIVKQATLVLGGTIEFTSKVNEGTTFVVTLPR